MVGMVMGVHELGVHIVPQYIHIERIWQVQIDLYFDRDVQNLSRESREFTRMF